jgi:hypothetical protein
MRKLPCAAGWQTLNPSKPADKAVLDAFLSAEFAAAQVQLKRQRDSKYYCPAGVKSASYSGYFLKCIIRGTKVSRAGVEGVAPGEAVRHQLTCTHRERPSSRLCMLHRNLDTKKGPLPVSACFTYSCTQRALPEPLSLPRPRCPFCLPLQSDNVQAQGIVTYNCKGSSKQLKLGLNAEGRYA